jgi:hypothetical protein
MTKEELENYYADLLKKYPFGKVEIKQVLKDLDKLDEPQKPVVPEIVNAYIQDARECDWDIEDLFNSMKDEENEELLKWFYHECNQETLALAWINGYTVVKEKRYLVKMKGIDTNFNFLNRHRNENYWIFSNKEENTLYQTHHTRKELEDAGFGWVFDCEGIEIKEVE